MTGYLTTLLLALLALLVATPLALAALLLTRLAVQMDLPTSGAPGFSITPTGPLARIEAHARAHDPRPA